MKSKHTNLILIILLLVAAAIAGGLYYLIHVKGILDPAHDQGAGIPPASTAVIPEGENGQSDTFLISFIGDCTLSSDQYDDSFEKTVDEKGCAWSFSKTKPIFLSDEFTIANLECSFSDQTFSSASLYYYCGPKKHAEILSVGGVDCVTLGNNHTNDFGSQGLTDTKNALNAFSIQWVEQEDAVVFETNHGIKIGIYCPGWTGLNEANIQNGIAALKSAGADICVFAPHWGLEESTEVTENQTEFAHIAVDAGAQIVYGTHPRVLQRVEEYNGAYIFYGAGTWIFGGSSELPDNDTAVMQVALKQNSNDGFQIVGYSFVPCGISGTSGQNDYCPVIYEEGTPEYERAIQKLLNH